MKEKITLTKTIALLWLVITLMLLIVVFYTIFAPAITSGHYYEEAYGIHRSYFLENIKEGGIYNILLMLLGLVMIVLAVRDTIILLMKNVYSETPLNEIEEYLRNGRFEEALTACKNDSSSLSRIVWRSLLTAPTGKETRCDFFAIMESNAQREMLKMLKKPNKYLFMGILALLVGALGASLTLIDNYSIMATLKSATPRDFAYGVKTAWLIATTGIVDLICSTLYYFFIKNRVNSCVFELKTAYECFIIRIKKG